MIYPTPSEIQHIKTLSGNFAMKLVNFILENRGLHNLPSAVDELFDQDDFVFDENIAKVVIALIKGEQRDDLLQYKPQLEDVKSYEELDAYITNYVRLFFSMYESNCLNICIAMGYVVMYGIFKTVSGWENAPLFAFKGVTDVLGVAQRSEFMRRDGLSRLSNYVRNLIEDDDEILEIYRENTYPW